MKKINVYIITYHNAERIKENISRFGYTIKDVRADFKLTIINNHSKSTINGYVPSNTEFVVWNNIMRPDHSCGHLSRDYNAALINGFGDLNNPKCDQVICGHDDIWYHDDWFEKLTDIHKKYDFYAGNWGCSMTSYLPSAVKTIGIWDERFINIAYHEADYFLRALIYNQEKSSINDHFGGRVLNPTEVLFEHPPENKEKVDHSNKSLQYHPLSRLIFEKKWNSHPEQWHTRLKMLPDKPLIPTYAMYPYFEKDIDNKEEKGYTWVDPGLEHFKEEWK